MIDSSGPQAAPPWRHHRRRRRRANGGGVGVGALLVVALAATTTTTAALPTRPPLSLHLLGPRVWNHSLPLGALLDGVSHPGGAAARARLAALARQLAAAPDDADDANNTTAANRKPVRVVALGGSITCGHMVERGVEDWFSLLTKEFLPRAFPQAAKSGRLRATNGCIPATQSEMASLCLDRVLGGGGKGGDDNKNDNDKDGADLVLVEFSVNDGYAASPSPDHPRARAFERLLRTVMQRRRRRVKKPRRSSSPGPPPAPPAVVLVHLLPTDAHKLRTPFYASAETDYDVLARYYGLPSVSLRAALWHRLFAAQAGFSRDDVFPETEERHPTPLGHRYVADLIVWLLQRAVLEEELGFGAFAGDAEKEDGGALPHPHLGPPMFRGNAESKTQACLVAEDLPRAVAFNRGWKWVNDAKKNATTAKWGYASDQVGATLVLRLDTRAHAADDEDEEEEEEERDGGRRRRRRLAAAAVVVPPEEVAEAEARGLLLPPPEARLARSSSSPSASRRGRQLLQAKGKKKNKKDEASTGGAAKAAAAPTPPPQPAPPLPGSSPSSPPSTPNPNPNLDDDDATIPAEQTLPPESTPKDMFVWIGYVASWRQVGSAVVWCARHCRCDARVVDAWQASKTTQQVAARLPATQSPNCWVAVRVLNETSTGGHAFKVTGAMVGRRTEEGLFGDASEMTVMEAFNPGGGEGMVEEEGEGSGGDGGAEG